MISSGTTAVSTSGDTAVTLIAANAKVCRNLDIINEGSVAGFFSIDGGNTWARLPASSSLHLPLRDKPLISQAVLVKRVASGTDLATVWGFAY